MMGHKMFLWRKVANYPRIITVTPSYLKQWELTLGENSFLSD